ncbi:DUF3000 domain-containing protein [Corynebacterium lizhenjunii]|uniref:DUF3000 domain-containing protein n=1 Tax=Corynebacterium lizhenjunii TaxID=2709394 RepID=A0A7T0PAW0_9CORY|nr:DUF3000 domain-containing protein [Corynebacterium lizhenjunii]
MDANPPQSEPGHSLPEAPTDLRAHAAAKAAAAKAHSAPETTATASSAGPHEESPTGNTEPPKDGSEDGRPASAQKFATATEALYTATVRPEISIRQIRPPQKLAAHSFAIGLEVSKPEREVIPINSDGDAFGRLILLHDPAAEEAWEGPMRLVAYIQADMDSEVASDPLLADVAWEWLTESLRDYGAGYTNLGGTVTSTASVRFGEIGGPPRAHQLEMRASWTAEGLDLSTHTQAFAAVLANVAGLPPEGVAQLKQD